MLHLLLTSVYLNTTGKSCQIKIVLKISFQKHPAIYQYLYSMNTGM